MGDQVVIWCSGVVEGILITTGQPITCGTMFKGEGQALKGGGPVIPS